MSFANVAAPARIADVRSLSVALDDVIPQLARHAARNDELGSYPFESIELLRRAGLLAITLPRALGGIGFGEQVPFQAYLDTLRRLSSACSSTAQIFTVHANAVLTIGLIGGERQVANYAPAIIANGEMFSFVGSEPTDQFDHTGKRVSFSSYAKRTKGGWIVTARKVFATGSVGARRAIIHCTTDDLVAPENWLLVAVELNGPGVEVIDNWDNMGQRATSSGSLNLTDVFVPDNQIIGGPGAVPRSNKLGAIYQTCFAALLTGIAEGAFEFAKRYLDQSRRPTQGYTKASEEPNVQLRAADISISLVACKALLAQTGITLDRLFKGDDVVHDLLNEIYQLRVFSTQSSVDITSSIFVLCGTRATTRSTAADMYWRNARTLSLHDNIDKQRGIVGRYVLGVERPAVGIR